MGGSQQSGSRRSWEVMPRLSLFFSPHPFKLWSHAGNPCFLFPIPLIQVTILQDQWGRDRILPRFEHLQRRERVSLHVILKWSWSDPEVILEWSWSDPAGSVLLAFSGRGSSWTICEASSGAPAPSNSAFLPDPSKTPKEKSSFRICCHLKQGRGKLHKKTRKDP